jgi:hypothetical protein
MKILVLESNLVVNDENIRLNSAQKVSSYEIIFMLSRGKSLYIKLVI